MRNQQAQRHKRRNKNKDPDGKQILIWALKSNEKRSVKQKIQIENL